MPGVERLERREADGYGTLVLVGSAKPQARAQVERLAEEGALVLTLTRQAVLDQDETFLMGIRSGAAAALKQGRHVVVRSENWPEAVEVTRRLAAKRGIAPDEVEQRVRQMLARVGEGVVRAIHLGQMIAVGADTCAALCRQLGLGEPAMLPEAGPGLRTLSVPGPEPLQLVLKAGDSGDADTLWQAIQSLSDQPNQ